ncbi:MAG: hypothetical protein ABI002_08170 [Saprospiraceae bacterium]
MKSTSVTNATDWANSNAQHIRDLNSQKKLGRFQNCTSCNPSHLIKNVDEVNLHIVVEDLSAINQEAWKSAIKGKITNAAERNNIKIIFSQIE